MKCRLRLKLEYSSNYLGHYGIRSYIATTRAMDAAALMERFTRPANSNGRIEVTARMHLEDYQLTALRENSPAPHPREVLAKLPDRNHD